MVTDMVIPLGEAPIREFQILPQSISSKGFSVIQVTVYESLSLIEDADSSSLQAACNVLAAR